MKKNEYKAVIKTARKLMKCIPDTSVTTENLKFSEQEKKEYNRVFFDLSYIILTRSHPEVKTKEFKDFLKERTDLLEQIPFLCKAM